MARLLLRNCFEEYQLLECRHCLDLMWILISLMHLGIRMELSIAVEKLSGVAGTLHQALGNISSDKEGDAAQQLSFCDNRDIYIHMLRAKKNSRSKEYLFMFIFFCA